MTIPKVNPNIDEDLRYEDYVRIIAAKSGEYDHKDKAQMTACFPYFQKGYLELNRQGDIWLTRKGVDVLLAVGCEPLRPREFLDNYPHMLDRMKDEA